jgi:hypothetical protein
VGEDAGGAGGGKEPPRTGPTSSGGPGGPTEAPTGSEPPDRAPTGRRAEVLSDPQFVDLTATPDETDSEDDDEESLAPPAPRGLMGHLMEWDPSGRRVLLLIVAAVVAAFAIPIVLCGFSWWTVLIGVAASLAMVVAAGFSRIVTVFLVVALLVVPFGVLEGWNGVAFHTLALWNEPPDILWCGRTYAGSASGPAPRRLVVVGTTPSGIAIRSPGACSGRSVPIVYLKNTDGTYRAYAVTGIQ